MPAYLTGHIKIRDVQKWHEYLAQVDATITAYGGEILLRGLQAEVLAIPTISMRILSAWWCYGLMIWQHLIVGMAPMNTRD
jgi:hypothetical protein